MRAYHDLNPGTSYASHLWWTVCNQIDGSAEIGHDSAGATKYKGGKAVSPVIFAMPPVGEDLEKFGGDDDWGSMVK